MSQRSYPWAAALVILAGFLAIRTLNLTALPVFFDEAVHLRWAKLLWRGQWLTAAADGRLLFIWWVGVFWPFVETLWLGRVAMVLALLPGVAALISAGRELGNRWAGLLAGALLAVLPVALFYDRMVLADTVQATMTSVLIWLGIRLARHARPIEIGLTAAVLLTLPLTKVLGLFFVLTPALVALTQLRRDLISPKGLWRMVWPVGLAGGLFGVGFVVALGVLRWRGVDFLSLAGNNAGALSLSGIPLRLSARLIDYTTIIAPYFSGWALPLAVVGLVGIGRLGWRQPQVALALLSATGVPLLAMGVLVGPFETRYLLPGLPPLVLAAGIGLTQPVEPPRLRWAWQAGIALSIVLTLPLTMQILTAPVQLTDWLPDKDSEQYISGWTAGTGLPELAALLLASSSHAPVDVVVIDEGLIPMLSTYLGNEPSLATLYDYNEPHLRMKIFYSGLTSPFASLANPNRTVYLLISEPLNSNRLADLSVPYARVQTQVKPGGENRYQLYRVYPGGD